MGDKTGIAPRRVQRKRTRGWKMPDNTVYVGRPSKWGNMFAAKDPAEAAKAFDFLLTAPQTRIVKKAVHPMIGLCLCAVREAMLKDLHELRGKNLACWCPLDRPCHADVLLKLANKQQKTGGEDAGNQHAGDRA